MENAGLLSGSRGSECILSNLSGSVIRTLMPFDQPVTADEAMPHYNEAFRQLYAAVREIQDSLFLATHVVPARPKEGMIRLADGTDWNPGSGMGLYQYRSGVWMFLA